MRGGRGALALCLLALPLTLTAATAIRLSESSGGKLALDLQGPGFGAPCAGADGSLSDPALNIGARLDTVPASRSMLPCQPLERDTA